MSKTTFPQKKYNLPKKWQKKNATEIYPLKKSSEEFDQTSTSSTSSPELEHLSRHKDLFEVSAPRHMRSLVEWKPDKKQLEIKRIVGNMFRHLGIQTKNAYTLHPEEALFLLEMNNLELEWNSIQVSIQQAYHILLNQDLHSEWKHYRIYSQLLRDGYRMFRHRAENAESIEPPIKKHKGKMDPETIIQGLDIFNKNLVPKSSPLPIIYDGYHRTREINKSSLPTPDIHVSYLSPKDSIPSVVHSKSATTHVIALEGSKNIIFYNVRNIKIKNLLE